MQTIRNFRSKMNLRNSGIIARLFKKFLFYIIFPTVLIWGIYLFYLNTFFVKDTLAVQQTYLENTVSPLELSVSTVTTTFSVLEGIPEFTYYLDFYSEKRDMLYSLKKTIQQQCEVLKQSSGIFATLNIYSEKSSLLFADPFHRMEELTLPETELEALKNTAPTECLWYISSNPDITSIPELYAYKTFYAYNYRKVLGYIELKISPDIIQSFVNQFINNDAIHNSSFAIYQDGNLIYSMADPSSLPSQETLSAFTQNGCTLDYAHNYFINYVTLPDLNIQLVLTGPLSLLNQTSGKSLMMVLSLFILILLMLFVRFFHAVADLSQQIINFSSHIRHSDPDELRSYSANGSQYGQAYQELQDLIDSYNNLIQEKSTLMTQVRKMELLSQDASYQALQSQIHPHFIYGTLENIRMMALQNHDKEAADMIYSLSALLRQSLNISAKAVLLRDEIEISSHYLKIQEARFGTRLSHHFSIEEALLDVEVLSFICQPILENSILYGAAKTFDDCELGIHVYEKDSNIILELSNSGISIEEQRLNEINDLMCGKRDLSDFQGTRNGFALYNIKERLRIFFHGKATIHMELTDNRTKTIICIERSALHVSNSDC